MNARDELTEVLSVLCLTANDIKCAVVGYIKNANYLIDIPSCDQYVPSQESIIDNWPVNGKPLFKKVVKLKNNHARTSLYYFMRHINFEYRGDYGIGELYGVIWLKDGSYLERNLPYGELGYDWWVHRCAPGIPEKLL